MVSDRRLAASRISGVCEGTLTASFTVLRTPFSVSSASARSTAAAWPPITTWPGELKLAGTTTSSPEASAQMLRTRSSSAPITAAIAPVPAGAASCISWPRMRTRCAASCSAIAPAATSAVYSPRLWPASATGVAPPAACQARHTATPAASRAGCVYSVRLSCSSGPPYDSAHRSTPAPSEASAKVSRTSACCSDSSASIASDCDPCPGKTNASVESVTREILRKMRAAMIRANRRACLYPAVCRSEQDPDDVEVAVADPVEQHERDQDRPGRRRVDDQDRMRQRARGLAQPADRQAEPAQALAHAVRMRADLARLGADDRGND